MNKTVVLAVTLLAGCASSPGLHMDESRLHDQNAVPGGESSQSTSFKVFPITAQLIAQQHSRYNEEVGPRDNPRLATEIKKYIYEIAPRDVLSITIWNHPELTTPAGQYRSAEASGYTVGPDGTIFFPYIGRVVVAGKTAEQVQLDLTRRLPPYVRNPQIDVKVVGYRSQWVNVTGEVTKPGQLSITDVPMTLLDAVNQAGGVTRESDEQNVTITRNGKTTKLNLLALSENGDITQNILLKDGDIVNIPDRSQNKVFVLGEVNKQVAYQMNKGRLSLAEALGGAEGINQNSGDQKRIYVIRGNMINPTIFKLDGRSPDAMLLASQFRLQPHDVIYVSAADIALWNRVLNQILPSVQSLLLMNTLRP